MNLNRWFAVTTLAVVLLPGKAVPQQLSAGADTAAYYTAERLADDCASHSAERSNECFGVMQGVLHALLYLDNQAPFKGVLCIPRLSPADVKDSFLARSMRTDMGLLKCWQVRQSRTPCTAATRANRR